ncbi:hypothetical protein BJV82DRAFT_561396 [Fennellomyces sp. T-0311]|nr:hypothetical protein BJV82DRAFT_561396 [Fennellomyces sp. T-0311]
MVQVKNSQVIYTKKPVGAIVPGEHIKVIPSTIDLTVTLAEGEFLVKVLYLSVDPYLYYMINEGKLYETGAPLFGNTLGVVLRSNNPNFKQDDIVYNLMAQGVFEEYTLVKPDQAVAYRVRKDAQSSGLPLSNYMGALGLCGLTAYAGLLEIGKPKKGETLFVSTAAGAVGQLVAQIGKNLGLRVVGSTGSDDKVKFLTEQLGLDGGINYKTDDIDYKLTELCPNGIDIYFEQVGGPILDTVLKHVNVFARIPVCGMISHANKGPKDSPIYNTYQILAKWITIRGFSVAHFLDKEDEALEKITQWLRDRTITYAETIAEGIDQTPQALLDMLNGKSVGKQMVKVADF